MHFIRTRFKYVSKHLFSIYSHTTISNSTTPNTMPIQYTGWPPLDPDHLPAASEVFDSVGDVSLESVTSAVSQWSLEEDARIARRLQQEADDEAFARQLQGAESGGATTTTKTASQIGASSPVLERFRSFWPGVSEEELRTALVIHNHNEDEARATLRHHHGTENYNSFHMARPPSYASQAASSTPASATLSVNTTQSSDNVNGPSAEQRYKQLTEEYDKLQLNYNQQLTRQKEEIAKKNFHAVNAYQIGAQECKSRMREIDWESARIVLNHRALHRPSNELDLHGLRLPQALAALKERVDKTTSAELIVITGVGKHSPGKPVLYPAIKQWLERKYPTNFSERQPGVFVVSLRDAAW